jgi:hypothetical protein
MSRWKLVFVAVGLLGLTGCVERTVKIQTQPPGALVIVNDEEVGVSPVRFSFLWYGDYDIMVRKPGYQTLKTHYRIEAPWYQYPPFDIVAETMIPATIQDEHELPVLVLQPNADVTIGDVMGRAEGLRDRALYDFEE